MIVERCLGDCTIELNEEIMNQNIYKDIMLLIGEKEKRNAKKMDLPAR